MCVHPSTPLNERELVLLCDCVDELPENMRKIAMECGNVEKVLSSLPALLQNSQQPSQQRINAWVLHLLNELSPTVLGLSPLLSSSSQSICFAYCQAFLLQFQQHYTQTQTGSQLSEYAWTDTDSVLVAEGVRYVIREGDDMRLEWVMKLLPVVRLQPVVMLAIARMFGDWYSISHFVLLSIVMMITDEFSIPYCFPIDFIFSSSFLHLHIENMHFIPENDRTDQALLSLLNLYALVLNNDSHVLREAWLQLFTAFKQPDVRILQIFIYSYNHIII